MSSTKHSECGDSDTSAGDVGKPLEDHDLNENVEEKKTDEKEDFEKWKFFGSCKEEVLSEHNKSS